MSRRPALLLAAALVGSALALAACTGHNELGTSDSACYIALPTAAGATGHRDHLVGTRMTTAGALRRTSPTFAARADLPADPGARVCLVAFSAPGRGGPRRGLTVAVVTYPGDRVRSVVTVHRAPLGFGHFHLG